MSVNLERYRTFYFTARHLSFSAAADELFISQSAVSQSVKQLEEELNSQLFLRTGTRIKLTSEGKILFKYIEQAYKLIETGERKLDSIHLLQSGELNIGAGDTISKHYLLNYLQTFHQQYPDVRIQVTNRTSDEIIELLKKGDVDLGIINLPYEDSNLDIREVLEIQDCFVAGEKYIELAGKEISIEELSEYPLLLLEEKANSRRYLNNFFLEKGIELRPEIELGSIDLLVEFAGIGLGIACVIENFLNDELKEGKLYKINLKGKIPSRSIGIALLKNIPVSAAANTFINLLLIDG